MPDNVFNFNDEYKEKLYGVRFNVFKDAPYYEELLHAKNSLLDLIVKKQNIKLENRGFVVQVSGSYGEGKTLASWALVNELQNATDNNIFFLEKSLIPFGNPNEAISAFLSDLAYRLWREKIVDIRSDIQEFIFEVVPKREAVNVSASLGPIKVGRDIKMSSERTGDAGQRIKVKLKTLKNKHRTIIVLLDDLDRLLQHEIVQIMRVVEKLRSLPYVIVILPIYKEVITEAFEKTLQVTPDSAPTFLRKLTDYEVALESTTDHLKKVFINTYGSNKKIAGMPLSEFVWYSLLHNIIVREATARIEGDTSAVKVNQVLEIKQSPYLHRIRDLFYKHTRLTEQGMDSVEPYPTHWVNEGNNQEFFAPLGLHYQALGSLNDSSAAATQLSELRNADNVLKLVTNDPSVKSAMYTPNRPEFDINIQNQSSSPALVELFIPLLRQSDGEDEPFLTNNYKARDIIELGRRIKGYPSFNVEKSTDIGMLYSAVRDRFDKFR